MTSYLINNFKYIAFIIILIYAGVEDYKTRKISDKIHIFIILISLINLDLRKSLLGLIFISISFLAPVFFDYDSIGGGDIKLAGAMGFFLGYKKVILAIILGLSIAIVVRLLVIKDKDKVAFPLGPYLAVGGILSLII